MKRFIIPALVAFVTFLIGVGSGSIWMMRHYSKAQRSTVGAPADSNIPSDTFVTLERTGCYGDCPIYTVAISADGTVIFTSSYVAKVGGVNQWKKSGVIKGHITNEQVRQLIPEFDRINYFSLQDSYLDARDGCPALATDMSSVYTSIQINGRKKSIAHYLGCLYEGHGSVTYPKELVALETAIDQIINTKQWMQ